MNRSFKQDYKKGLKNEKRIKKLLKTPLRYRNPFSMLDMRDDIKKCFIEVKQRYVRLNTYPTLMIGKDKYEYYLKQMKKEKFKGYKLILICSLLDGDYYCVLNELCENNKIEERMFRRYNRQDKKDIEKMYLYINKEDFHPLCKYSNI